MWPFKTQRRPNSELEERLEKLERNFKALTLDWDSMYEKFQRLSARLAKRQRDAERAEETPQDAPQATNGHRITNPAAIALLRGHDGVLPR